MANNTNELSTRLRQLRESKRLSREEVADYIQVPYSTYATWENGTIPKASYLKPLAKLYDITVEELLGETSSEKELHQKVLISLEHTNRTQEKLINFLESEVNRLRGLL